MDFTKLTKRAKDLVAQRGGVESLKKDAAELKNIAKGPGSASDKAKAAARAVKEPGSSTAPPTTPEPTAPAPAPTAAEPVPTPPPATPPAV